MPVSIYQVVIRLGCGGLEKMVVHLARALDPARFRVTVCCLEDPGELAAELSGSPVTVIGLGKQGFEPGACARLARRLRRERVRIVHTHNPAAHLYGAIAAHAAGVPAVVQTRHGPRADARRGSVFSRRWLWRLTDAVVPVSRDSAELFLRQNDIAPDKVTMIANGVAMPVIRTHDRVVVREEWGIPAGAPTVGIVARLAPEKEHSTLLSAFARVREVVPVAHLLIVGDGPLRPALEQQAAEQQIAPYVHFAGFRSDVDRMLAAMDLYVLCSRYEGTSLTLLEAMGARLPIVATAVGGTPDVVGSPENARLVPAQDPDALAGALIDLLSDPDGARAMAERAHARMKAEYAVETMAARYEALYARLLERGKSGTR